MVSFFKTEKLAFPMETHPCFRSLLWISKFAILCLCLILCPLSRRCLSVCFAASFFFSAFNLQLWAPLDSLTHDWPRLPSFGGWYHKNKYTNTQIQPSWLWMVISTVLDFLFYAFTKTSVKAHFNLMLLLKPQWKHIDQTPAPESRWCNASGLDFWPSM